MYHAARAQAQEFGIEGFVQLTVRDSESTTQPTAWSFMGSCKVGFKSLSMGYRYTCPTCLILMSRPKAPKPYNRTRIEPYELMGTGRRVLDANCAAASQALNPENPGRLQLGVRLKCFPKEWLPFSQRRAGSRARPTCIP